MAGPMIAIQDLAFRWSARDPVVLALPTLQIDAGECVFIRGPSGSGKSSLLGLLAGVSTATQGSVRILGQPLEQLGQSARDRFRADHIGVIFQMFNLLPYLPVLDNVLLPCRFSARRRAQVLTQGRPLAAEAGRLLAALDLPAGLAGRPVSALSVGQQQRVAAARALLGAPPLVLADEPTSALDPERREAFVQLLFRECRRIGATLVMVSHDAALEPLFDRTLDLARLNPAASTALAG